MKKPFWLLLVVVALPFHNTAIAKAKSRDTSAPVSQAATVLPIELPGGVACMDVGAATDSGTGYVVNTSGGIDALDLKTGALLWTSSEASKPLIAFGHRLLAAQSVVPEQP